MLLTDVSEIEGTALVEIAVGKKIIKLRISAREVEGLGIGMNPPYRPYS